MGLNNRMNLSISFSTSLVLFGVAISFTLAYNGYVLHSMLLLAWCILDVIDNYLLKDKADFSRNLSFWDRNLSLVFVGVVVFDFANRALGVPSRTNPSGSKLSPEEYSPFAFDGALFIFILMVSAKLFWVIARLFSSSKEGR